MKVTHNGMTYDSEDTRCQYFIAETNATLGLNNARGVRVIFISVLVDDSNCIKRYFGTFDITMFIMDHYKDKEKVIKNIMMVGGEWPIVFQDLLLPEGASLSNDKS